MFKSISDDIAFLLVRKRIVDNNKREMYSYGAEVVLLNTFNIIISLIISLVSNTMNHFIVFLLIFIPLRMSIGGYHAKTSGSCAIISTLLYILSTIVSKILLFKVKNIFLLTFFVFSLISILIYAPIENKNNPLSSKLKRRNRFISLTLVGTDSIAAIIACIYSPHIATSIMIFVILASILMIIGRFQNKAFLNLFKSENVKKGR